MDIRTILEQSEFQKITATEGIRVAREYVDEAWKVLASLNSTSRMKADQVLRRLHQIKDRVAQNDIGGKGAVYDSGIELLKQFYVIILQTSEFVRQYNALPGEERAVEYIQDKLDFAASELRSTFSGSGIELN